MPPSTERIALVIGAAGGIGSETAAALIRHGWSARGLTRRPRPARAGLEWVPGDAMNGADVMRAAEGASLIVHAANPPGYGNWDTQVLPMIDHTIAGRQSHRRAHCSAWNGLQFRPRRLSPAARERRPESLDS